MNSTTFAIHEVANVVISKFNADPTQAKPLINLEYLTASNLSITADTEPLRAGQGNTIWTTFINNDTQTITLTSNIFDIKMIELLTGATVEHKKYDIDAKELLLVQADANANYVVLKHDPYANSLFVNKVLGQNSTLGEEVVWSAKGNENPDEGKFSIVEKADEVRVYFNKNTCPLGTEVICNYSYRSKTATWGINYPDRSRSQLLTLKFDCIYRSIDTQEDVAWQGIIFKARGRVDLQLNHQSTEPSGFTITLDIIPHRIPGTNIKKAIQMTQLPEEDVVGEITVSNVTNNQLNLKVSDGAFVLRIEEENVKITSPATNNSKFTVNGHTITPVSAGSGKITLSKYGYKSLDINITVTA